MLFLAEKSFDNGRAFSLGVDTLGSKSHRVADHSFPHRAHPFIEGLLWLKRMTILLFFDRGTLLFVIRCGQQLRKSLGIRPPLPQNAQFMP
jgi:hypothetical protein